MILADTSVWVDHLRSGDPALASQLRDGNILAHTFVIGEIALGYLDPRDEILTRLQNLPSASMATDDEVLNLIGSGKLFGTGIGYVDAHLLASVRLTPGSSLWTRDRRLNDVASRLGIGAKL